jgi:hypothetical protein
MPVLATLLLLWSETRKRKLNNLESAAVYLVFWGFCLFAFWENLLVPKTGGYGITSWLADWIFPLILGIVVTIIGFYKLRTRD